MPKVPGRAGDLLAISSPDARGILNNAKVGTAPHLMVAAR